MADDLFPEVPSQRSAPREKLSPDRERTLRNEARIARGIHPLGSPLRQEPGETCGSCAHLRVKTWAGVYFKCALAKDTKGPASDLRKKWPACASWAVRDFPTPRSTT